MKKRSDPFIEFMKAHHGYARTQDLRRFGLQSRHIKALLEDKTLERMRRGYYKLSRTPKNDHHQLVDVCAAKSQAVIALASALEFYGLTTYSPSRITIALPHNHTYDSFRTSELPVKVFFFPKNYYESGIETLQSRSGPFRIYSREKTICDMFRYRKTFGEDVALEGLKNYLRSRKANIQILQRLGESCGVSSIINPYIKALAAG